MIISVILLIQRLCNALDDFSSGVKKKERESHYETLGTKRIQVQMSFQHASN